MKQEWCVVTGNPVQRALRSDLQSGLMWSKNLVDAMAFTRTEARWLARRNGGRTTLKKKLDRIAVERLLSTEQAGVAQR